MHRPFLLLACATLLAAVLAFSLWQEPLEKPANPAPTDAGAAPVPMNPLVVFCAASNRAVMEAIAADYRRECDVPVEFQFGPSQTLLASIEVSRTGDLYLPADSSYLQEAQKRKLIADIFPLARMHVIVGVPRGNPKQIERFADLLQPGIRLVQANPDIAAVGKLTREALAPQGKWDALKDQTDAFVSTVTEAANAVTAGAADAAIIYDAILTSHPELEPVKLPEFAMTFATVELGLLSSSRQVARARHFAEYVAASDRGLKRYAEFGFSPVDGRAWQGVSRP